MPKGAPVQKKNSNSSWLSEGEKILSVMQLTPKGFYGRVSVRKQTWAAVEKYGSLVSLLVFDLWTASG